jgi:anaerobic selenocysteine-containing dehydrogenase
MHKPIQFFEVMEAEGVFVEGLGDIIDAIGATDGGWMTVETPTGKIAVRIAADDSLRRGVVSLPHGCGQAYPTGEGRLTVGPCINALTAANDCDPIAATPYHKNVRVRLTPLDAQSAAEADAVSLRLREVAESEAR